MACFISYSFEIKKKKIVRGKNAMIVLWFEVLLLRHLCHFSLSF